MKKVNKFGLVFTKESFPEFIPFGKKTITKDIYSITIKDNLDKLNTFGQGATPEEALGKLKRSFDSFIDYIFYKYKIINDNSEKKEKRRK